MTTEQQRFIEAHPDKTKTVLKALWQEEQEKILGIIEDDAQPIPEDYFEKAKSCYTHD